MRTDFFNELQKLDRKITDGLSGVHDSLAYRVAEIEAHLHGMERWYGSDGDGLSGSTANNLVTYQLAAGVSGAFGSEVQVLAANDISSSDFPVTPLYFDAHRIMVTNASDANDLYILQIWSGTGLFAAATMKSETPFYIDTNQTKSAPIPMQMNRISVADKVWLRLKSTADNATCNFILGVHVYKG